MNSTLLTKKAMKTFLTRTLMLAVLAVGLTTAPAFAQADVEYKKAYNAGLEAYKAKKIDEAYKNWEKAAQLAAKVNDNEAKEVAQKSRYYVSQLDYKRGLTSTKNEKFQEAMAHFEKGISHDPTYAKNFLGKALALKKLDREDDAMTAFQKTMEVAKANSDRDTAERAESAIRDHYHFMASSALSKESPSRSDAQTANNALEAMQKYVEADADTYFYYATAANAMGDYAQAVAHADKALEMHRGSKTSAAKIWFVKGEALMYSGDTAGAKAAFQNATYGNYKAPAEHYISTLGR